MKILLRKLRNWLRQKFGKCQHVAIVYDDKGNVFSRENTTTVGGKHYLGDWGKPEPHPVPRFANRIKIERRPFAMVMHCTVCGFVGAVRGHDQRDIDTRDGGTVPELQVLDKGQPIPKSRVTERTSPHARRA